MAEPTTFAWDELMNEERSPASGNRSIVAMPADASVALADLLREHGGRVAGYLRKRFPGLNDEERYDVLVDALVLFARSYDGQRGPMGPWLLLLAHQRAIDCLRCEPHRRPSLGHYEIDHRDSKALSPPVAAEQAEAVAEIHAAIAKLAPTERAVIEADLEVGGAANARRLAEQIGTTERAVYAARARAREKLLVWLKD